MNVNQVTVAGRLTRDPDLRYIPSGTAVCEFGLAINRRYKDREEVCFVDIVLWGKSGETLAKYLKKGDPVCIPTGRLTFDQWEDREGNKRSRLRVTAQSFEFVGGKKDREAPEDAPEAPQPAPPKTEDIPF